MHRYFTTLAKSYVIHFRAKGWKIKLIDIGGLRSERRKWIHCFDKLMAVIFIADLSNYDESDHPITNSENGLFKNKMLESMALFSTVLSWFQNSDTILYLNKSDLLIDKIKNSHIKDYIPNYDGPQRDVKAAKIFIKNQFQDIYNCRHKPDYKGSLFDFTENDIRFLEKCKKSNKCHRTDSHELYTHFTCFTETTPSEPLDKLLGIDLSTMIINESFRNTFNM